MALHSYYSLRYNISAVIGFSILFVLAAARAARGSRHLMAAVFVVILGYFSFTQFDSARGYFRHSQKAYSTTPPSGPFLLYYSTGPFAWLFSRLQQERPRQMTVVSTFGEAILFRVEPTAYSGTRSLP
jgi:hypothetical protein